MNKMKDRDYVEVLIRHCLNTTDVEVVEYAPETFLHVKVGSKNYKIKQDPIPTLDKVCYPSVDFGEEFLYMVIDHLKKEMQ